MTVTVSRSFELVVDSAMLARMLRACAAESGAPPDLLDAGPCHIIATNEVACNVLVPRQFTTLAGVSELRVIYRREYEEP